MFWNLLLIISIVCLILSAVGFIKYVYFMSVGYGFAVAGGGITILVLALQNGWTEGVLWLAIAQDFQASYLSESSKMLVSRRK